MHAYALLKTSTVLPSLPGGMLEELQVVRQEGVAAVVEPGLLLEDLQQEDARLLQAVLAHDRIIRELFSQATVLPLRFTSFAPLETVLADLHTHQQHYLEILDRLEGKAEFTITLTPVAQPETPISPELTGKAYFLARKQQVQQQHTERQQQAAEIERMLTLIGDRYPYVMADSGESETRQVHLLAPKLEEGILQQAALLFNQQSSRWQLSLGAALPPYHFVESR
jgi:hypothetical protein